MPNACCLKKMKTMTKMRNEDNNAGYGAVVW